MRAIKINMNKKPVTYRILLQKKKGGGHQGKEQMRCLTLKDYTKNSSIDNIKEQLIKFLDKLE